MLLERERAAAALGLAAVAALAWAWLWRHAGMAMAPEPAYLFVMWWIMMAAMMLPSAAPMILLFSTLSEKARAQGKPYVPAALFAATYLVLWGLFSAAAAAAQWWVETRVEPVMTSGLTSRYAAGALLLAAGAWQLTPLKHACLRQCRAPLAFLMTRWRPGVRGALAMGVEHGAYCIGCCWALMALLFVGGVMNLWWVVGLALFVLLEKLLPAGERLARAAGAVLLLAGAIVLLYPA